MTFSDAEEDQPSSSSSGHTGATVPNGISSSSVVSNSNTVPAVNGDVDCSIGSSQENPTSTTKLQKSTNSSNRSQLCEANSSNINVTTTSTANITSSTNAVASNCAQENGAVGLSIQLTNGETSNEVALDSDSNVNPIDNSLAEGASDNLTGLETEKIMEKLHQIHGYIEQTTTAMQALEIEGDLNKIGQYNTLVKCMRELKKSESKLTTHLNKIENSAASVTENSQSASGNSENPSSSQKNSGGSGSVSIGTVETVNENGGRQSMQERLSYHEHEQQHLSERLRESLVRRQELMTRYQATKERLNNLKRERLGIVQEERRLLHTLGAPENPYENPIQDAQSWSIEQLEKALEDFRGLGEKVERLYIAYTDKLEATPASNTEVRNDLQRKVEQITNKKNQINSVLDQMNQLLQAKREGQETDNSAQNQNMESGDEVLEEANAENDEAVEEIISGHQENLRAPTEDDLDGPGGETTGVEEASVMSPELSDIKAKQQHLQSLKDQLNAMKTLLHVSENAASSSNGYENATESNTEPLSQSDRSGIFEDSEDAVEGSEEPLVNQTIVGVNGEVICLSECERRNPGVVMKYRQLSEAKKRLAKMEEVMLKIAEARQSGKSISDVLSPENMAILNDARDDVVDQGVSSIIESGSRSQSKDKAVGEDNVAPNEVPRSQRHSARELTPSIAPRINQGNSVNRMAGRSAIANEMPEWGREREISAMQFQLKKATPGVSSVNEGFTMGREKGAIKKQTRELLSENGAADPRVIEVLALQEELKEKKNALEALMRRMGKSSSFTVDNISDNFSENVSDLNSETMERPSASWGAARPQARYFSDPCPSDDEELLDTAKEEAFPGHAPPSIDARQAAYRQLATNAKNRNQCNPPKVRGQDINNISVNNLKGSVPKSTRPKQNRYPRQNVPIAAWENVQNVNTSSQNLNDNKVQNTVTAALSQLNYLQETINSLYGDLRTVEMTAKQQEMPTFNAFGNTSMVPPPMFNLVPQNSMPNYCLQPLPLQQGRSDLGASSQVLAGIQQCFSQLYLHSLEIHSLSKHLQVRPTYPYPSFPYPNFYQPQPPPSL